MNEEVVRRSLIVAAGLIAAYSGAIGVTTIVAGGAGEYAASGAEGLLWGLVGVLGGTMILASALGDQAVAFGRRLMAADASPASVMPRPPVERAVREVECLWGTDSRGAVAYQCAAAA